MRTTLSAELAGKLWRTSIVRGITALVLGAYVLVQPPISSAGVARASAAYWIVDGLVALWTAAFIATFASGRIVLVLRGVLAAAAGVVMLALPLDTIFGAWQPGQLLLWLVVVSVMLTVIAVQIAAGAFDVLVCLKIRRRLPGEWSFALGAALSITFAIIAGGTFAAPAALLARVLGITAVVGGLALLVGSAKLHEGAGTPPLTAYPDKR